MKKRLLSLLMFLFLLSISLFAIEFDLTNSNSNYQSGDQVTYTLKAHNDGDKTFKGKLDFLRGGPQTSYFEKIENSGFGEKNSSTGDFLPTGKLEAKNIEIAPGETLTYKVKAKVGTKPLEEIKTVATLYEGETLVDAKSNTMSRAVAMLSEASDKGYVVKITADKAYYEKWGEVTYTINIRNTSEEDIDNLELTSFNSEGFQSIEEIIETRNVSVGVNRPKKEVPLSINITKLEAGGELEYEVKSKIGDYSGSSIGDDSGFLENEVKEGEKVVSNEVSLRLLKYDYTATLTPITTSYTPGGKVEYKLEIKNNEETPINNLEINPMFSNPKIKVVGSTEKESAFTDNEGNKTVNIGGKETKTYTITRTVNEDAIGDIGKYEVQLTDNNGETKEASTDASTLISSKSASPTMTKTYDDGEYTITVKNTGGIVQGVSVKDVIVGKEYEVANSGGDSAEDKNLSITKEEVTITKSVNGEEDKESKGDLNDTITLYPNKTVTYKVKLNIGDAVMTEIVNTAILEYGEEESKTETATATASPTHIETLKDEGKIKITKTKTGKEYFPGDAEKNIEYTITVENPTDKFANNIEIKDIISKIRATDIDGNSVFPFSEWELIKKSKKGTGSVYGNFAYETKKTSETENIDLTVDIGPGGKLVYTLKAKVKENIIGEIRDNVSGEGDNVPEQGDALKLANSQLRISKTVDGNTVEYESGSEVIYYIDIENQGKAIANYNLEDELAEINFENGTQAYTNVSVTKKIMGDEDSEESLITDELENLNDSGIIGANKTIRYTVTAELNPDGEGVVVNTATLGDLNATKGIKVNPPKKAEITIEKNGRKLDDGKIEYTITVKNIGEVAANGIQVEDVISDLEDIQSNLENSTAEGSTTLSTTIDLAAGREITYTITGTLKDGIDYPITNTATATYDGKTVQDTVTIYENTGSGGTEGEEHWLTLTKELSSPNSTDYNGGINPSDTVYYTITITNNHTESVTISSLKDIPELEGMDGSSVIFDYMKINEVGDEPVNSEEITIIDKNKTILAGETLTYSIEAKTNIRILPGKLINRAELNYDNGTGNGRTLKDQAELNVIGSELANLNIKKSIEGQEYAAGKEVTTVLEIENPTEEEVENVLIEDLFGDIMVETADGQSSAFEGALTVVKVDNNFTDIEGDNGSNFIRRVNIPAAGTVKYKITTKINLNAKGKIVNKFKVGEYDTSSAEILPAHAYVTVEKEKIGYYKDSDCTEGESDNYSPNSYVKYEITLKNESKGTAHDYHIKDNLSEIEASVLKEDETEEIQPVFESWEIDRTIGDTTVAVVSNTTTTNLDDTITVKAGETITYTIRAKIKPLLIGSFRNTAQAGASENALTDYPSEETNPGKGTITISKTAYNLEDEKITKYNPGDKIYYLITLLNDTDGIAYAGETIKLEDDFTQITGETKDGRTISLFDVTTTVGEIEGVIKKIGSSTIVEEDGFSDDGNITFGNSKLEVTGVRLAPRTKVEYKIEGTISPESAADVITNRAKYGSKSKDAELEKDLDDVAITNRITKLNGATVVDETSGGGYIDKTYTAGNFIEYTVKVTNNSDKKLNNIKITNDLTKVTADLIENDGIKNGSAFFPDTIKESGTANPNVEVVNGKLEGWIDELDSGETLEFVIKAQIKTNAVGDIFQSIAYLHEGTEAQKKAISGKVEAIQVEDSDIGGYKEVKEILRDGITLTKEDFGDNEDMDYQEGDIVTYLLRLTNKGENWTEKISIKDDIKGITSFDSESKDFLAFSNGIKEVRYYYYPLAEGEDDAERPEGTDKLEGDGENVKIIETSQQDKLDLGIYLSKRSVLEIEIDAIVTVPEGSVPRGIVENKAMINSEPYTAQLVPTSAQIVARKYILKADGTKVQEDEYVPGAEVTYCIEVENISKSTANNITLLHKANELSIKEGSQKHYVFRDSDDETEPTVKITRKEGGVIVGEGRSSLYIDTDEGSLGPGQTRVFTITGTTNRDLRDEFIPTTTVKHRSIAEKDENLSVKFTPAINVGELEVTKTANKKDIKIGEPVEYTVTIKNTTTVNFTNVSLKDIIPPGFRYVKGSTEIIYSGPDGKFVGTNDILDYTDPVGNTSLIFEMPITIEDEDKDEDISILEPGGEFKIKYILIPSIGVNFGRYKNQAYATVEGERRSNIASVTVSIRADELLDTASIIGKVFYDHNQNGYQEEDYKEAGIPGVRLISPRGYIAVTDRFGRYHMPDVWVYNRMGQNAEVKLDITTLPENTKVISENPKIKRISTAGLTKFNFSVVVEEGKFAIDTTRIYLEKGAIWVVNDFVDLDPELELSMPERIVVKNRKLTEPVDFSINTNYADFISRYELLIYSQTNDIIKKIEGQNLYNDMTITWEDMETISEYLLPGKELKVRLCVWNKEGKMDKTELGHIDLVGRKTILDLFNYDTKNDVSLLTNNILLNGNLIRIVGDGLEGVSTVIIKDDEYSVDDNELFGTRFIPSGKNRLPVKVEYEDGREQEYELITQHKDTYYIGTAIIDLTFGKNHVTGNRAVLGEDNPYGANYYDDKIYREGRLAIFGKGRYKDKLRFTTYIDTKARDIKAMFDHVFDKDDQTIFERQEDTDTYYYPTYGDKSYIYRHVDTDGDIYFKAEYEESYLMWGNYNTDINHAKYMNYNRTLYGAKLDYTSSTKTDYGDSDKLIGFMSKPYSLFGHDEFLGTGGSLYFLKNNDVLNGSEKVYIKVVNGKTDRTEKIIDLVQGEDYEFDAYQGRIILDKPLKAEASFEDEGIIQDSASGDYYNYLVVDYEYIPTEDSFSNQDYGVYARKFLSEHLGLGATYIKENRDNMDYRMKGAELILKFTENSYIKGEVSESEGVQSNSSFISLDGGLSFTEKGLNDKLENTGQAFVGEVLINLGDIAPNLFASYGNELSGWYEEKDAGYSFASKMSDTYIKSYGSRLTLRHSDRILSNIKYEEYEEREGINKVKGAIKDKYRAITAEVEYLLTDRLVSSFAYKYIKELADDDTMVEANIIGMRLEYEVNDDLSIYAEGQGTVSRDEGYEVNNRGEIGFDADITDYLSISGSTSIGTRGNYSEIGLDYDVTDKYSIYIGGTKDGEDNQEDITFGQKVEISDKLDFYQESQVLKEDGNRGRADTYGLDYDYSDDLSIGASVQYGKIELPDDEGEARRKALSVYLDYDTTDFEFRTKLEYREDKQDGESEKVKQYLTTNYFEYTYDTELTFGGKFNYAYTDDEEENDSYKFIEGSLGMAFRPVENDRLNFLARYTYILNDDPNDSESLKAHIAEFEAICDATERLDLGLKLAYRDEEETYIRESGNSITIDNAVYLVGLRANYVVLNDWEVYLEYHWLVDRHSHDVRDGAIVGLYKNLHTNLKIGGGYNFSGFSSDISEEDYESHGWFINIVGRF